MKPKRLPVCGQMTGTEHVPTGNGYREVFCQNVATFRTADGREVCEDCAVTEREDGEPIAPIEPQFWADLIDAMLTRHRREIEEAHRRFADKLARADKLEAERDELLRMKADAERRAFIAETEIARLNPIAIELERFKRPLPTIAPTGIGGVVPDGQRLEIE